MCACVKQLCGKMPVPFHLPNTCAYLFKALLYFFPFIHHFIEVRENCIKNLSNPDMIGAEESVL